MVKILPPSAGGAGSIPGRGAKVPHASPPRNQNRKQKKKRVRNRCVHAETHTQGENAEATFLPRAACGRRTHNGQCGAAAPWAGAGAGQ